LTDLLRRLTERANSPFHAEPAQRELAVINASFLYFIVAAGEPDARWLAEIALDLGCEPGLVARAKGLD
jgi:hypothetical protein